MSMSNVAVVVSLYPSGLGTLALGLSRRHLWRTRPLFDLDDLLQEGLILADKVIERYAGGDAASLTPKHLEALFYRSFYRRILTIARQRSRRIDSVAGHEPETPTERATDDDGLADAEARLIAADAPEPLRSVLLDALDRGVRVRQRSGRETTNSFLCRLAGVSPSAYNLRGELEALVA